MNAKQTLRMSMGMGQVLVDSYLKDLSDADLMLRPVEGMNHIAWQLGHLISSERRFVELLQPGSSPALPEGFEAAHTKEATHSDDPAKFFTREQYLAAWKAQRDATLKVLDAFPESRLGESKPEYPPFANTAGALFHLIGTHPIMHAGQWVAVRRKLNKPVAI